MSDEEVHDVIVLGGGASGIATAYHCTRTGLNTIWLDMHCELYGGGGISVGPNLDPGYYLVKRQRKIKNLQEDNDYQLTVIEPEYIDGIELDSIVKVIETDQGSFKSKVVIFATTLPKNKLGIKHEERYYKTGDFFYNIPEDITFKDRHVVVLGNGNWAVRNALYLDEKGAQVTLVSCCKLGELHRVIQRRLDVSFIEVFEEYKPIAFHGSDKQLKKISFDVNGRKKSIDGFDLVISTGCSCCNTSLLEKAGVPLDDSGKIVTIGDKGQTVFQGVFAVGFATKDNLPIGALDKIGEQVAVHARSCLKMLHEKKT